jgi:hypothetical protein
MRDQEILGLMEAYASIYAQQEEVEQLDEERRDPRGRVASGPMSVYGGRGKPSPDPEGDDNVSRMDRAQRRVKATQPAAKGRAADSLNTKYSARQRGLEHGGEEGPGPKAPKRSGRKGRGANTDRGGGNAASRRAGREPGSFREETDLFDYILEHLVAEGYADTNEAALAIMANMSEEWREDIVEAAKDQSNKQIEKGIKTTYKAGNVIDNQHQGRSSGLSRLPSGERVAKTKRMRERLKGRRDDLFKERGNREDAARAELKKRLGL